jgi:PhnB protein
MDASNILPLNILRIELGFSHIIWINKMYNSIIYWFHDLKQVDRMETKLNPYLNFKDNARQAMEFYKAIFGGKLTLSTFKEYHASQDPSEDDKIMHAELQAENGVEILASDTPNRMEYHPGSNFSLSLSGDNEADLKSYFEKLSTGGSVTMPLEKAVWGDTFGMCTDKFGISWMVNITAPKP